MVRFGRKARKTNKAKQVLGAPAHSPKQTGSRHGGGGAAELTSETADGVLLKRPHLGNKKEESWYGEREL